MTNENYRNIYAIGDIHGVLDDLLDILNRIFVDGCDLKQDLIIQVGDIIDGGHQASLCVEVLRNLQEFYPDNVVVLLGNHEQLLIDAIGKHEHQSAFRMWWLQGGAATYQSYVDELPLDKAPFLAQGYGVPTYGFHPQSEVFKNDIEWFKGLPLYFETKDFIFVHAGLREPLPPQANTKRDMLWIRDEFHNSSFDWGKIVIYGHTARDHILVEDNKIGIDLKWHGAGRVGVVKLVDGELDKTFGNLPIRYEDASRWTALA